MIRPLLAVFALCACALQPPIPDEKTALAANVAEPKGKMTCRFEIQTGSHIPERVCQYDGEEEPAGPVDIGPLQTVVQERTRAAGTN
jgi:hypothetical protein